MTTPNYSGVRKALRAVAAAFEMLEHEFSVLEPKQSDGSPSKPGKKTRGGMLLAEIERPAVAAAAAVVSPPSSKDELTKAERKILTALAQLARPMTVKQITLYTGLTLTGGSSAQALADLRREGFVDSERGLNVISDTGKAALGAFPRLPEGYELFDFWCHKMGSAASKILHALRDAHNSGRTFSLHELEDATGLTLTGGSSAQALADLRRLELIERDRGSIALCDELSGAAQPTVRVFNAKTGQNYEVDRKGNKVR